LSQTPGGDLLWDYVGLIDHATVARIEELGRIAGITISHAHYYNSMVDWRRAFDKGIIPSGGKEVACRSPERLFQGDPRLRRNALAGS
jgi:hypothetical protein